MEKLLNSASSSNANTDKFVSRTPMILELGTGSALRSGSYTKAAVRAVEDALWHNSINLVELFDGEKSNMYIDVEIACQKPEMVDVNAVSDAFPYGQICTKSVKGGLDITHPAKPDRPPTIIAHAAIIVSLNLIKKEA